MEEIKNVLKLLVDLLGESLWVLTGSTSLFLYGVDIEANDIDILTDGNNAEIIDGKLQRYCTDKMKYSSTGKICSYFGKYMINGIKIEVMGDLQHHLDNDELSKFINIKTKRKYIQLYDLQIPVLSLQDELEGYKKMGRTEKVSLIEKIINKQK